MIYLYMVLKCLDLKVGEHGWSWQISVFISYSMCGCLYVGVSRLVLVHADSTFIRTDMASNVESAEKCVAPWLFNFTGSGICHAVPYDLSLSNACPPPHRA